MVVRTSDDSPPFPVVLMASSAGGLHALTTIIEALPADFPAAIVIVQHRTARLPLLLSRIIGRRSLLPVFDALDQQLIRPGNVYIARPDLHLIIEPDGRFSYLDGGRIRYVLSSANPLFASGARTFGPNAIAVVLTGCGMDGTDGVQDIRAHGGTVIAQDEATSAHFGMPGAAIDSGAVDYVKALPAIAPMLMELVARLQTRLSA